MVLVVGACGGWGGVQFVFKVMIQPFFCLFVCF